MAGKNRTYHEKKETGYVLQLRGLLADLPPYARDYFRAVEQKSSAKTRISYAYDLQVFLRFLIEKNPALKDKNMRDIALKDLDCLTSLDIFLRTKVRDIAIVTLFLGTGIRVSECVGLDLNDVNFRENSIRIVRKGGNEAVLYFGEEVEKALLDYIEGPRAGIAAQALPGEENALFFSLQKRRISVHAVENLVEKYAREFVPQKKITPHKLRSTFGTSLYQETEDIYLVADVLGHSDVGTTRKHYAAIKDQNRRKAAQTIRLRENG